MYLSLKKTYEYAINSSFVLLDVLLIIFYVAVVCNVYDEHIIIVNIFAFFFSENHEDPLLKLI